MWLRTIMNRQYRYGGTLVDTATSLYRQGGVGRFYKGVSFALIEGPLSRGVGAAANYATLHMMAQTGTLHRMPTILQTAVSSLGVASFRLLYYPLDTAKTILQVEGRHGIQMLRAKLGREGISSLYHGATFSILGASLRHTLWFGTYNVLASLVEQRKAHHASQVAQHLDDGAPAVSGLNVKETSLHQILTNAGIGLACSLVTDLVGNPLSMLKAYRQTQETNATYVTIAREIVRQHGLAALFTRGLGTRIWVDALNSIVFTVAWRILVKDEHLHKSHGGSSSGSGGAAVR